MFTLPFQSIVGRIADKLKPEVAYPAPTPYKQASNSVPHLFVDKQERISTREWSNLLSASPSTYEHCKVVSLTWAKALESDLSHEFIQFIVEDTRNGIRTRVFSDRQNDDDTDHVIVGWDWSGANNPSKQKDMPLPLKSLVFNGNDRPSVAHLAKLLAAITARAPSYNIVTMCWWYAWSVFESAKAEFGGEVKEWPFSQYAYKMIVWDYVVTPKYAMEDNARAFKKQNVEGMSYQAPAVSFKKELSTKKYLNRVGAILEDEDAQKDYEEALGIDGTEKIDPELLKAAVENAQANATDASVQTLEDKKASDKFAETILAEPEKEKNLEAFEEAWQRNMRAEKNVPADDETKFIRNKEFYFGQPGEKEKEEFDEAMQCFVGGVLRLLAQNNSS